MDWYNLLRQFSDTTGGYWAGDNEAFAKTDPSFLQRAERTFNPMTGLGSALGEMYKAAGNGDLPSGALAAMSAMPAFGYMKATMIPGQGYIKSYPALTPSWRELIYGLGGQLGTNEVQNMYDTSKKGN